MSTTRVTVCVMTRARLGLLRESLASVLAQDHSPLEIVVSDNWSDDGTREHVLGVARRDPRVRYVRPPASTTLYGNHNFAFSQAHGEYVCFFHDDDLYRPTVVSRCAAFLDAFPGVGAVCADFDRIDSTGRILRRGSPRTPTVEPGLDFVERTLRTGTSSLALSGTMARRAALPERPFDEDGPIGFTDMVTWFRLAESHDIGHIGEHLWSYRAHAGAFSNKPAEQIAEDHGRAFVAYCDEYLARHPGERERVARWRNAIERYRFWLLLYGATVRAASGASGREAFEGEVARTARTPLERVALGGLRVVASTGWRAPLELLRRYGLSGRGLIGLR